MAFDEFKKLLDQYTSTHPINWPQDQKTREQLCRALLGAELVGDMDRILDRVNDWLEKPESPPTLRLGNELSQRDRRYRSSVVGLSEEHREAVRGIARYVVSAALFRAMVAIDQFPACRCRLVCTPRSEAAEVSREIQVAPNSMDLHDDLVEWILEFSRYADLLAYRVVRGPNSSEIGIKT